MTPNPKTQEPNDTTSLSTTFLLLSPTTDLITDKLRPNP